LASKHNAQVVVVNRPKTEQKGAAWNQAILDAINTQTRVVAMPHVHWTDGTVFDLEAVGKKCRSVGAALVIDGTQSIGAYSFDWNRIQPDAVICAGYKWLMGSYGLGLAYLGERFDQGSPLEDNWMHRTGSDRFAELVNYQPKYRPKAQRYNMGEASHFTAVAMLTAALDQLLEWGVSSIEQYTSRLTSLVDEALVPLGFRMEDEAFRAPHLFGIRLPDHLSPESVAATLKEAGISVSVRGTSIRVSAHVYNRQQDLLALHNALKEL
jgi:selenocysteine lyase/cysteine desulfurase